MPLRILIPILLIVFSFLVTLIGYLAIRSDLTVSIEQQSVRYMNIELSKLQSLLEPLLTQKNMRMVSSLHTAKVSELDSKAMLITTEEGIVAASSNQQDLQSRWQSSQLNIQADLAEKAMANRRNYSQFSADRNFLNGYINLCVKDLSKGLRSQSCGFLYYQLDVKFRQEQARSWLIKQSYYIALGSSLVALLLMLILHFKVTRRVLKIQSILDLWSKGNRDVQIQFKGNDELTHIANIINDLVCQFASDEKALIFNKQVNDAIIQSSNYSIITTDTDGVITTFNASAEKLLGYKKSEVINKKPAAIFHDAEEIVSHHKKVSAELGIDIKIGFETLVAKSSLGQIDEDDWTYIHKDRSRIPVRLSITALYDTHGNINGYLGVARDISEHLKTKEQLEQLAYFDPLTQLPNRMLYTDRLNQNIVFAERNNAQFSIFFMDLDKFKFVNDTYGHEVGDKLLIKVAEIVTHCVRKSDTVARLGGDEFTLILSNTHDHYDRNAIGLIAQNIITEISQDIMVDDYLLQIGASIGIATYPDHGSNSSDLNKNADIAMYQAKEQGRGQYVFYNSLVDDSISKTDH